MIWMIEFPGQLSPCLDRLWCNGNCLKIYLRLKRWSTLFVFQIQRCLCSARVHYPMYWHFSICGCAARHKRVLSVWEQSGYKNTSLVRSGFIVAPEILPVNSPSECLQDEAGTQGVKEDTPPTSSSRLEPIFLVQWALCPSLCPQSSKSLQCHGCLDTASWRGRGFGKESHQGRLG